MMKRFLLAGVALVSLAGGANAADFVVPDIYAPMAMEEESWATFYIGIHGGGATGSRSGCYDVFVLTLDCSTGVDWDYSQSGLLLGAQAGATFQITNNVFAGVEVDASLASITGELNEGDPDGGTGTYNWLATGTAKLGYAFDRFAVYGEAGVAIAGIDFEGNLGCDTSENHAGGVVGVGGSYQFTDNLSAFAEYNHVWLPTVGTTCQTFGFLPTAIEATGSLDLVKVGLNYSF